MAEDSLGNKKQEVVDEIKKGRYMIINDAPCVVTEMLGSAPGKHGHKKWRITGVGLLDDKKRVLIISGGHKIEVPMVDKRNGQVLSVQDDKAQVMDSETYEVFEMIIPEEFKDKLQVNANVQYWVIMSAKVVKGIR